MQLDGLGCIIDGHPVYIQWFDVRQEGLFPRQVFHKPKELFYVRHEVGVRGILVLQGLESSNDKTIVLVYIR